MNSEQLSDLVIDALEELKAKDIVKLDVRRLTTVTDYMIVASGTSNRHVKALADAVAEKSREAGHRPTGIEGTEGSEWVLLDLQDTLVHVMLPRVRAFYNLEKLWSLEPASDLAVRDR
jgi:ribosome-associated protein